MAGEDSLEEGESRKPSRNEDAEPRDERAEAASLSFALACGDESQQVGGEWIEVRSCGKWVALERSERGIPR